MSLLKGRLVSRIKESGKYPTVGLVVSDFIRGTNNTFIVIIDEKEELHTVDVDTMKLCEDDNITPEMGKVLYRMHNE